MTEWDAKKLGGSIKRGIVHPDLQAERDKCSFDLVELEKFILGEKLREYLLEKHKLFQSDSRYRVSEKVHDMSRTEVMEDWWRVF